MYRLAEQNHIDCVLEIEIVESIYTKVILSQVIQLVRIKIKIADIDKKLLKAYNINC